MDMAKTKKTPRKIKEICPLCFTEFQTKDEWSKHLLECANTVLMCKDCHKSFKKKEYLQKHVKTFHPSSAQEAPPAPKPSATSTVAAEQSDWDEDPGELLGDVSESDGETDAVQCIEESSDPLEGIQHTSKTTEEELLEGRVFRKRTHPSPLVGTRKVICRQDESVATTDASPAKMIRTEDKAVQVEVEEKCSVAVQTQPKEVSDVGVQMERYRKRIKEVTVMKYTEGGRSIENVREVEEFYNM